MSAVAKISKQGSRRYASFGSTNSVRSRIMASLGNAPVIVPIHPIGFVAMQEFIPGLQAAQEFIPGLQVVQEFIPGMQAMQTEDS